MRGVTAAPADGVDQCEVRRITGHADIEWSEDAVNRNAIDAVLEPVGGQSVVKLGVARGTGITKYEKESKQQSDD